MKTLFRTSLSALLCALMLPAVSLAQDCTTAQEVTVRDINLIPQANIDILMAAGTSLDYATIFANLTNDLEGETVKFRAVVLTDWRNSGLATPDNMVPNRIHMYVRDVNAETMGVGGMTTQIVDEVGAILASDFLPGDVVDVCGIVNPFTSADGKVMQISPVDQTSITLAPVPPVPSNDPLRQPVPITIDDIHQELSDGTTQILWTTVSDFRGQFVRLENLNIVDRDIGDLRPDILFQSVGENTFMNSYDTSLRYRNDRHLCPACYPNPPFNTRPEDDPFIPPSPGGVVNVQGFLGYQGWDGFFGYSTPASTNFALSPWVDEDFEILSGPPIVVPPSRPDFVPGNEAVPITAIVQPGDPARTITGVDLDFSDTAGRGFGGTIAMTNTVGDTWEATIPAAPDGIFVFYSVTATDSEGDMTSSGEVYYRVLYNGITSIEEIQRTPDGLPGDGPFEGITTTDIDLDATVQADFFGGANRYLILQDDPGLDEWTGIWAIIDPGATVAVGDVINVSEADIEEAFGLTQLFMPTFTVTGSGSPYPHKVLTTGLLNGDDPGFREAHEGLLVRFNAVTITDANADGPDDGSGTNFGEWQFSSDATEANEVRADDLSDAFPSDFNLLNFMIGYTVSHIQGAWYYSFSNYKVVPVVAGDIGTITVSNEPVGPAVPGTYLLHAAYPNPFNPSATIRYEIGAAGPVTLKVYDALGREVAVLVDATLPASTYEVTFNASGLSSGIYIYRLVAGNEVLNGSMTLVK